MTKEEKILKCGEYLGLNLKKRIAFAVNKGKVITSVDCKGQYDYKYCFEDDSHWSVFDPYSSLHSLGMLLSDMPFFFFKKNNEKQCFEFFVEKNSVLTLVCFNSDFSEGVVDYYLLIKSDNDKFFDNLIFKTGNL